MTKTAELHTTREVADMIAAANILPGAIKALSQRSIARLCRHGDFPGAYVVQGDWCVPRSGIDAFIAAAKSNKVGRARGKKKDA